MADVNPTPTGASTRARARTRTSAKAREALPAYGTSDGVLSFRHGLLARERGTIDKALEIVGRYLRAPGAAFAGPDAVKAYMRLQLAGETCERFAVLYLDSLNRSIAFEIMFTGTLTQTSVHPREVVRAALAHGAASVILAHNHPSGTVLPSSADEALTQTLKAALALIDVRVLDHIVVGGKFSCSFAEHRLL